MPDGSGSDAITWNTQSYKKKKKGRPEILKLVNWQ
jgi:hypothetical protein